MRGAAAGMLLLLGVLAVSSHADAQSTELDAERFKPAVTHDGFITAEGSGVRPEDDRWEIGLGVSYAHNPLVTVNDDDSVRTRHVGNRLGFDVLASLTIVGPFALGLDVPFFVPQFGDLDPAVGGLGDIRLVPKVRLLDDRESVGLGIVGELRVPTRGRLRWRGAQRGVLAEAAARPPLRRQRLAAGRERRRQHPREDERAECRRR